MTNYWQIFKAEFKEWWKEFFSPFFSNYIGGINVQKATTLLISLLVAFSTASFIWFIRVEDIPYPIGNFNIHIISFLAFIFLIIAVCFLFLPAILYFRFLLRNYKIYFLKDNFDQFLYWNLLFSPAYFCYFLFMYWEMKNNNAFSCFLTFFCILFFFFNMCSIILLIRKKIRKEINLISFKEIVFNNFWSFMGLICAFSFFSYVSYTKLQYLDKELTSNWITIISLFSYPVLLFITTYRFNSKIPILKHIINCGFIFITCFVFYCGPNFIKRSLYDLKLGGDYPIQLEISQDILCQKYSFLVNDQNMCIKNPNNQNSKTLKDPSLVLNLGGELFFIKEKCEKELENKVEKNDFQKSQSLKKRCKIRSIHHKDVVISY